LSHTKEIGIPLLVGGLTLFGFLLAPGSFLIHPTFEIIVMSDSHPQVNDIIIVNTGWVQAKNVNIHLRPPPATIETTECPEYTELSVRHFSTQSISLERMSQNLPCAIIYVSANSNLTQVTVTADDSPAFVWEKEKRTTEKISVIVEPYLSIIPALVAGFVTYFLFRKWSGISYPPKV